MDEQITHDEPNKICRSARKMPASATRKLGSGFLAATSFFRRMAPHAILERS